MKINQNLAVVILNYNDSQNTIRYTNEIKNYQCIDKIIVVDNHSSDNSYEKLLTLSSNKIDVIKSESNKGYAYGNNYAIHYLNDKYGEFHYIAISNPDVEVSEDAYNQCLKWLDKDLELAIVAPRMYDINNQPHQLSGWKLRTLKGDILDSSPALTALFQKPHMERYEENYLGKKIAYVDCVAGSFFIIRHEAFKKADYFDENTFLYFEEDILGNKLKSLGYKNAILNTCKFKHFESVTIDKNMNFMHKYKNLQKSKKYYHSHYNNSCNHFYNKWKILLLDFVTFLRPFEERIHLEKYAAKLRNIFVNGISVLITKVLLLLIQILLLPFYYLQRKLRRKPKVLYFSLVTWKWIKQRPHFVALQLVNSNQYKVDYCYQTLYEKYMPKSQNNFVENVIKDNKNFKIKPFTIFPANTKKNIKLNSICCLIKTSFWNYDKIILTQPNQLDFFFMKVQKLKKVQFYYEAMDNYEAWEIDKAGYLDKQRRLVQNAHHLIVSSDKLKEKFMKMYGLKSNFCTVIRNGYDEYVFKNYDKFKTHLQHPCITYIGTVDDWFDFESICLYAKKNQDIFFNIIGPVNQTLGNKIKEIKKKYKNIIFHGPIEHHMVPQYIEDSDIMMMPFLINDVIEYVDPVKLYEYLYMKKPIISSYWSELSQFEGLVYFYNKENDFEKVVNKALHDKFKINDHYKKLIKNSTWENRVKEYLKVLEK